jgi:acyl-CoA thioester hydrolase
MTGLPFLTPLDAAALAAQGIPSEWRFGMADRVRFAELDALNHVNHTAYLRWFETLRLHYVRAYGFSAYDGTGPELVLKGVEMAYHAPMHLSETYIATARTLSYRTSSFRMAYAVHAPDCRAEGTALIVQLRRGSAEKVPLDPQLRHRLTRIDGAEDHS